MILLSGASGCGKTTTAKCLESIGCSIVPTYTTRKLRDNDLYTISVSNDEFNDMVKHKKFMSHVGYNTKNGKVRYGIPVLEYKKGKYKSIVKPMVIINAYEYTNDIIDYIRRYEYDPIFKVFIDVDYSTIVDVVIKDENRLSTNNDLKDRLKRDDYKMRELKDKANLIIDNSSMKLSPDEMSNIIIREYTKYIDRMVTEGGYVI